MTIFQPELAKLSAEERYGRLLTQAEAARKLKLLTKEKPASTWRLPTGLHLSAWLTGWLCHYAATLHLGERAIE